MEPDIEYTNGFAGGVLEGLAAISQDNNEAFYEKAQALIEQTIYALLTDGAHHKQYHIEQALLLLCGSSKANEWLDKFKWTRGIEP